MISFLKAFQTTFQSFLTELPEGLRVVLDFIWKVRWFLAGAFILVGVYNVLMTVLPFLLWTFALKSIFGSLFSIFF